MARIEIFYILATSRDTQHRIASWALATYCELDLRRHIEEGISLPASDAFLSLECLYKVKVITSPDTVAL